jgi:hypothetical protein
MQDSRDRESEHITLDLPAMAIDIFKRSISPDAFETAIRNAPHELPDCGAISEGNREERTLTLPTALVNKLRAQNDPGLYVAKAMMAQDIKTRGERDDAMEAMIRATADENCPPSGVADFTPEDFPF